MNQNRITDEMLMAWADGELDPATEARVGAAIAADESLAARAALFRHAGEAAREALEAELEEPVPEALAAAVRAAIEASGCEAGQSEPAPRDAEQVRAPVAEIVDRPPGQRSSNHPVFALAASVVVCLAGLVGYAIGIRHEGAPTPVTLAVSGGSPLTPALEHLLARSPSGVPQVIDGSLRAEVLATFRDGGGRLCREFRVSRAGGGVAAVACRDAQGAWGVRYAQAVADSGDTFQPAAGAPGLNVWLASIEASEPITGAAETEALARE